MKIFKLLIVLSLLSTSLKAETLDEALAKTRARFALKADKAQRRNSIKGAHKAEIEGLKAQIKAIREEQKQELKQLSAKGTR